MRFALYLATLSWECHRKISVASARAHWNAPKGRQQPNPRVRSLLKLLSKNTFAFMSSSLILAPTPTSHGPPRLASGGRGRESLGGGDHMCCFSYWARAEIYFKLNWTIDLSWTRHSMLFLEIQRDPLCLSLSIIMSTRRAEADPGARLQRQEGERIELL